MPEMENGNDDDCDDLIKCMILNIAVAFVVGEFGRHRCWCCCCFLQLKVTHSKWNYAVDLYTYLWQISQSVVYFIACVCVLGQSNERMYCFFFLCSIQYDRIKCILSRFECWIVMCYKMIMSEFVWIPKALTIHTVHTHHVRGKAVNSATNAVVCFHPNGIFVKQQ